AHHRPHLDHRRRRDDAGMAGRTGCRLVDVDGVLVSHRVNPVVNHRLVDRIPARLRLAAARGLDLFGRLLNIPDSHLGTLGTFKPDAAIISRITSFTPPPKVMTRLRLVWESSQFSSSEVSESAGLPYLPTTSSASRPTY